ncbi:winged helix-turn-helix transcriptional regulator [Pedobacter sp. HDW13]|uniref:MarR family winged helix-turn-helix transcriptional regulator n=1 Tax=Pedobacter sp. HDW13 TaxID=2714940 RepID=UPI00140E5B10|nr:MarR family winged helix-turn-helix transcriptional regulator [Pedobacter sp. HDW13]QIL40360.1 winged helix-turn-helix transcriptional regulator [Pedobacter sp. HDW13]
MKNKTSIIQTIRSFNRNYTKLIGLLDSHLLASGYSLAEARILYEIHANMPISASDIILQIDIDKGYLSKVLKRFETNGLISKSASSADARMSLLALTPTGNTVFNNLNAASNQQVKQMIGKLTDEEQEKLRNNIEAISELLFR